MVGVDLDRKYNKSWLEVLMSSYTLMSGDYSGELLVCLKIMVLLYKCISNISHQVVVVSLSSKAMQKNCIDIFPVQKRSAKNAAPCEHIRPSNWKYVHPSPSLSDRVHLISN